MKKVITVIGAGGKMGMRINKNLVKMEYGLFMVENGEAGMARVKEFGFDPVTMEDAVPKSDFVIMAVPDAVLGKLSKKVTSLMQKGSAMITLDPAAAFAGELQTRPDCTFVVTHPCHPPMFGEIYTKEEREDVFGGTAAKQDIVIALLKGEKPQFEEAKSICTRMFAPVVKCHEITVEQMALLEPAAAEVAGIAAGMIIKESIDELTKRGVPEEASMAFMLGHIQIALAILLKNTNPFSDAAKIAAKYGYENIVKPDWKKIFEPDSIKEVLKLMLHPE